MLKPVRLILSQTKYQPGKSNTEITPNPKTTNDRLLCSCGKSFINQRNLNNHQTKYHPNEFNHVKSIAIIQFPSLNCFT